MHSSNMLTWLKKAFLMASMFIVSSEQTNSITLEANSTILAVGGGAVGVSTECAPNNAKTDKYTIQERVNTT